MFAIIGLGNPGERYTQTRHNVGFWASDCLARAVSSTGHSFGNSSQVIWQKKAEVLFIRVAIEQRDAIIIKPQAFMNLSGQASQPLLAFYKIPPQDIIVIHDELDLPPGALMIKRGGGDAGHRGIKDLIKHLGSGDFIRVRIGVGHPRDLSARENIRAPGPDVTSWVLGTPSVEDKILIEQVACEAAAAVQVVIAEGLEAAQRKFNKRS